MPLTAKGQEILAKMKQQYGEKKGEEVFYASANKGTITGVHDEAGILDAAVKMCDEHALKRVADGLSHIKADAAYDVFKAGGKGMSEADKKYYAMHEKKARALVEELRELGHRKKDIVPRLIRGYKIRAPYNIADIYTIAEKIVGEYTFNKFKDKDKKIGRSSIGWTDNPTLWEGM